MPENPAAEPISSLAPEFLVACLCAEWCATCRDYRAGFEALSAHYPAVHFLWVDIEDDAAWAGDFDIEDFPTLVIQRGDAVLFCGTMLPQHAHLRRQIEVFLAQPADQALAYASGSDERRAWQTAFNVRGALRAWRDGSVPGGASAVRR